MSRSFWIKRDWKQQPSGLLLLDETNDLAKNLEYFIVYRHGSLEVFGNSAAQSISAVSPIIQTSSVGLGWRITSNGIDLPFPAGVWRYNGCIAAGVTRFNGGNTSGYISTMRQGSSNRFYLRRDGDNAAYGWMGSALSATGGAWPEGTYGVTQLEWGDTYHNWFFNNKLEASGGAASGAPDGLRINGVANSSTLDSDNLHHWSGVWSQPIGQGGHQELVNNPWQLFKRDPLRVIFDFGAAGTSHATTGTLTGQGSTIAGASAHYTLHATTGAIIGPGSTLAGTAVHYVLHDTSGSLVGPGAAITGTANRVLVHATTGALAGPGASLTGTSVHYTLHTTTGALTGPGSSLSGNASNYLEHSTTGVLTGQWSAITGTSTRISAGTFSAYGDIVGPGSVVTGTATVYHLHETTGTIQGPGAAATGTSVVYRLHETGGTLTGSASSVTGTASVLVTHETTGSLVGDSAYLDAVSLHIPVGGFPSATKGGAGYPKTIIIEEEERKPKRKKKARKQVKSIAVKKEEFKPSPTAPENLNKIAGAIRAKQEGKQADKLVGIDDLAFNVKAEYTPELDMQPLSGTVIDAQIDIVVEPQDPGLEIINLLMADIDRELLAAVDKLKELNKFYAGLSIQMH